MRIIIFILSSEIFVFLNYQIFKNLLNIKKPNIFMKVLFLSINLLEILFFLPRNLQILNIFFKNIASILIALSLCFSFALFLKLIFEKQKIVKFNPQKREFFKKIFDSGFLFIAILLFFKGLFNSTKNLKINEVTINLKNLKNDLNLAVISDLHIGEFLQKDFLEFVVKKLNSTKHDAVLIVGDLIDISAIELKNNLEPLKEIKKPIFFVSGNHEYYHGIDEILKILKNYNFTILQNECVEFMGLNLLGVNDKIAERFSKEKPNLNKALKKANPDLAKILLAHQPKYVYENVKNEVDLCICGHTHGGVFFPLSLLVWLNQKYLYGLYNDGLKQIYVSSGAGFWGPPMRFFAPSEIAILKLRKA